MNQISIVITIIAILIIVLLLCKAVYHYGQFYYHIGRASVYGENNNNCDIQYVEVAST
jgi:hypothetical protein